MLKQYSVWFDRQSKEQSEALPLGCGGQGALVFGGSEIEKISFTEESFWSGGFEDRNNKDTLNHLELLRRLVFEGEFRKAEQLSKYVFSGTPANCREFLPLCELFINFYHDNTTDYKKELLLNDALCTVSYRNNGSLFKRECFFSRETNVFCIKITTDSQLPVSFDAHLKRDTFVDVSRNYGGNTLRLDGSVSKDGISYTAMLRGAPENGKVFTLGDNLMVEKAKSAVLYYTAATSFRSGYTEKTCLDNLARAEALGFEKLYELHLQDHRPLFESFELEMDCQKEPDYELLFHMGRYLLISSSREGGLPAHSQGIWAKGKSIRYDLLSMEGYRLISKTNLDDCYAPFFEMIKTLSENGVKTAREVYGCRGSTAHTVTDLWGDTAPSGELDVSFSPMGLALLCNHIWEHYDHTLDISFLWGEYELFKNCALFFLDYLVSYDNEFVTAPSVSPKSKFLNENGERCSVCPSSAWNIQIIRELFNSFIKTAVMFNNDYEIVEVIKEYYLSLPRDKTGSHGIMAWQKDYTPTGKIGFSQLYSLYPSARINREDTKELADAAEQTLNESLKSEKVSADSKTDRLNMWTRLKNASKSEECLEDLWNYHIDSNLMGDSFNVSLGVSNAILGMIVQSSPGRLYIFPALPDGIRSGSIKKMKINGGAEIDLSWKDGLLEELVIYSHKEKSIELEVYCDCNTVPVFLRPDKEERITHDAFIV